MIDFEGIGDLLDAVGAKIDLPQKGEKVECGGKPPKSKPIRFTEWNNLSSFLHNGYLAKITHSTCEMCGKVTKLLHGIFVEEIHRPTQTRRLTALSPNAQWPANQEHRSEIDYKFTPYCGECVGELGFGREVEAGKQFTLEILP